MYDWKFLFGIQVVNNKFYCGIENWHSAAAYNETSKQMFFLDNSYLVDLFILSFAFFVQAIYITSAIAGV